MQLTAGVTAIRPEEAPEVVRTAAAEGCLLFRLSTEGRAGRGAFFDAVRRTLPLDPPVVGSRSWDALADSLWEGIHALERGRVVVLWPDAASFAEASPEDFRMAVDLLTDTVEGLSDEHATLGRPTELCVYVGSRPPCEQLGVAAGELLTTDEIGLLRRALMEWGGPARCSDELAFGMGFSGMQDLLDQCRRLRAELGDGTPISPVDWARILLAVEIVFVSDLAGSGVEWQTTTGFADDVTIRTLRSIQRKLVGTVGFTFGKRPCGGPAE